MQFKFDVGEVLSGSDSINVVEAADMREGPIIPGKMDRGQKLCYIIDEMGKASATAQGLPRAITTSSKLKHSGQRVYLFKVKNNADQFEVVGLLKVGQKTLFVYDIHSHHHEVQPLCVLDFYVHESRQRQGYGRVLFEWMLQAENVRPQHIAIDRPSPKFLQFLAKHYNLNERIAQLNNFAIFVDFFHDRPSTAQSNRTKRYQHLPPLYLPSHHKSITHKTKDIVSSTNSSALPMRRAQSSASKDRVEMATLENLSVNNERDIPDIDKSGPPLLPRGDSNAPHIYKTFLSSGRLFDNNNTNCQQKISPSMSKTHLMEKLNHGDQHKKVHQNHCGRLSRRDYNYDVGLARHYSHTKLW